jgi:hypothetical protein
MRLFEESVQAQRVARLPAGANGRVEGDLNLIDFEHDP